jgi:hypothetical protein
LRMAYFTEANIIYIHDNIATWRKILEVLKLHFLSKGHVYPLAYL